MILIFFLCALGIVSICCFSAYLGLSSRSWPSTKGTVLSSQIVERKNSASSSKQIYYHPIVIYEYYVGTKKYTSTRESARLFAYDKREPANKIINENPASKEIAVYYHPIFKNIACINQGIFQIRVHLLMFMAGFIPLVSILIGIFLGITVG